MKSQWILAGSVVGILLLRPVTSLACGGCFHEPPPPTMQNEVTSVVTDHRMAFSISKTQTVLWDQVRFAGDPREFAWVLPIRAGAKLELSHDAWLAALDASTRVIIKSPALTCNPNAYGSGYLGGGYGGGGGGGCGGGSESSNGINTTYDPGGSSDAGATYMDGDGVMVVEQKVVGPYSVVTLHASNGDALGPWLRNNGFEIPANVDPIVKAYDAEGFDFIAMRINPGAQVRAMQPVRVITAGADPTLPLRMVTAGVGANVGLTLWVIGEGRWQPSNFPASTIGDVVWHGLQSRSSYSEQSIAVMSRSSGTTWLVETSTDGYGSAYQMPVPDLYKTVCNFKTIQVPVPCPEKDAGQPADASASDASDPDASDSDASDASDAADLDASDASETGSSDAGCYQTVDACTQFDDWAVATTGISTYDLRITRLRAVLPTSALAVDLKLGAMDQSTIPNVLQTTAFADGDPCAQYDAGSSSSYAQGGCSCETTGGRNTASSVATGSIAALVLASFLRRRRR